ncbi:MAG: dihydrolipoyl dehydrogenase family protein [Phycisphaerae bacterium]
MEYDAICIGGGPGGSAAAQQVVQRGGTACLIERDRLGGTCLNVGCMPTKALLASGERRWDMKSACDLALPAADVKPDGTLVMRRVHRIVDDLLTATRDKIDGIENLHLVGGEASVIDAHTVGVETEEGPKQFQGRCLVIATGSQPVRPDFLPWSSERVWTNAEAVRAETLPESLLVLGGGPLGCEFACAYAELGSNVCLVEMKDRLLPLLPEYAGEAARKCLQQRGVDLHIGEKVIDVKSDGDRIRAECESNCSFEGTHVLAALGRRACPRTMGLEKLGVECRKDFIPVDECCRTSVEGVFAAGDVAEARNHSHLAERMGVVAGDQIMGVDSRDSRDVLPMGVYLHPHIAHVGRTGEDARAAGFDPVTVRKDYADAGTAWLHARTDGGLELTADRKSGQILGATWIGPHAMDMLEEIVLAMKHELTVDQIYRTMHPHPSFQEMLHALAEQLMTAD